MDYHSIQLMGEKPEEVSPEEVSQLERQLGTRMPTGYQPYVTTLGAGVLNDTVRVYPPKRIASEFEDFQRRWNEYWFWEEARDVLGKETALGAIIVADTGNGDELIFHPSQPDKLYVLPRDSGQIFTPGHGLDAAIDWMLHGGVLDADAEEEDEDFVRPGGLYFEGFPPSP